MPADTHIVYLKCGSMIDTDTHTGRESTLGVECDAEPRGTGLLSGRGMLSIRANTPRTLSSEIRTDSRGSSPDTLNLDHTHTHRKGGSQ